MCSQHLCSMSQSLTLVTNLVILYIYLLLCSTIHYSVFLCVPNLSLPIWILFAKYFWIWLFSNLCSDQKYFFMHFSSCFTTRTSNFSLLISLCCSLEYFQNYALSLTLRLLSHALLVCVLLRDPWDLSELWHIRVGSFTLHQISPYLRKFGCEHCRGSLRSLGNSDTPGHNLLRNPWHLRLLKVWYTRIFFGPTSGSL